MPPTTGVPGAEALAGSRQPREEEPLSTSCTARTASRPAAGPAPASASAVRLSGQGAALRAHTYVSPLCLVVKILRAFRGLKNPGRGQDVPAPAVGAARHGAPLADAPGTGMAATEALSFLGS